MFLFWNWVQGKTQAKNHLCNHIWVIQYNAYMTDEKAYKDNSRSQSLAFIALWKVPWKCSAMSFNDKDCPHKILSVVSFQSLLSLYSTHWEFLYTLDFIWAHMHVVYDCLDIFVAKKLKSKQSHHQNVSNLFRTYHKIVPTDPLRIVVCQN